MKPTLTLLTALLLVPLAELTAMSADSNSRIIVASEAGAKLDKATELGLVVLDQAGALALIAQGGS